MDLAASLRRTARGAGPSGRPRCAGCRRAPLAGELLHVFDSGRALCTLCLAAVPAEVEEPARAERVGVDERPRTVVGPPGGVAVAAPPPTTAQRAA